MFDDTGQQEYKGLSLQLAMNFRLASHKLHPISFESRDHHGPWEESLSNWDHLWDDADLRKVRRELGGI